MNQNQLLKVCLPFSSHFQLSYAATRTTTSKINTTSKSTLNRGKTDSVAKKTTKRPTTTKSTLGGTDNETLPSYMRPTRASLAAHNATGSIGGEEQPKKRTTTKSAPTPKTKPGAKGTRPKKPKTGSKLKEEKGRLEPVVEPPAPVEVSTEQGVDALVAVGLAPTTPQTPGHDPVPHASDNESTGGLMETIDETPSNTCNVKHWILFSDAMHGNEGETTTTNVQEKTVPLKEHDEEKAEETEEIEETEAHEGSQLMAKKVDLLPDEKLVTTETVMEGNDSEGEGVDQVQEHTENPVPVEGVSLNQSEDPPVTMDCPEVLETEEASEHTPPIGAEVDPGTEAPLTVQYQQSNEDSSLAAPVVGEETSGDVLNSQQLILETENAPEVGLDPQEEEEEFMQTPTPSLVAEEAVSENKEESNNTPGETVESETRPENPVLSVAPEDEQKKEEESTPEASTSE
eukprot:g5677.t1